MRSSAFANPPPANRPAITGDHRASDRIPQNVMAIQITTASEASLICLELDSSPAKPKLIPVLTVYSKFIFFVLKNVVGRTMVEMCKIRKRIHHRWCWEERQLDATNGWTYPAILDG